MRTYKAAMQSVEHRFSDALGWNQQTMQIDTLYGHRIQYANTLTGFSTWVEAGEGLMARYNYWTQETMVHDLEEAARIMLREAFDPTTFGKILAGKDE